MILFDIRIAFIYIIVNVILQFKKMGNFIGLFNS